jgi:soluble lytic murein transglycosylase-like protein
MLGTGVYDHIVFPAAERFGVPPEWILATIGTETSFRVPAPNTWAPAVGEYAWGPMQILLSTAASLGFEGSGPDLAKPAINIPVGAAYLAKIRERTRGDFAATSSEYFSGDPTRYKTDKEVRRHVDRAEQWLVDLGGVQAPEVVDLASGALATLAAFVGFDLVKKWIGL